MPKINKKLFTKSYEIILGRFKGKLSNELSIMAFGTSAQVGTGVISPSFPVVLVFLA